MKTDACFSATEILLPDLNRVDGKLWAVVACDQYTSEPDYWKAVEKEVGDAPSTLHLILPEVYLEEEDARIPEIHRQMRQASEQYLVSHPNAMLYLERTQADGRVRRGIIGAVDLEYYDYRSGSSALIRATEGTVLERIPPRAKVRRDATLELPHVMLLIDDSTHSVIEPLALTCSMRSPLYDFDLMQNGGHVNGYLLEEQDQADVLAALSELASPEETERKYGASAAPLLFAVGDGNHSLATAKAIYEELKERDGEAAKASPARYALVEVVNLHDKALEFSPIYRVLFHCNPADVLAKLKEFLAALRGSAREQRILCIAEGQAEELVAHTPVHQLTVGTLQAFLDDYIREHPEVKADYIHGEETLRSLAAQEHTIGFLFDGMGKDELFRTIQKDGVLPRKTFSMGHANDKRFYLECRKIK